MLVPSTKPHNVFLAYTLRWWTCTYVAGVCCFCEIDYKKIRSCSTKILKNRLYLHVLFPKYVKSLSNDIYGLRGGEFPKLFIVQFEQFVTVDFLCRSKCTVTRKTPTLRTYSSLVF